MLKVFKSFRIKKKKNVWPVSLRASSPGGAFLYPPNQHSSPAGTHAFKYLRRTCKLSFSAPYQRAWSQASKEIEDGAPVDCEGMF